MIKMSKQLVVIAGQWFLVSVSVLLLCSLCCVQFSFVFTSVLLIVSVSSVSCFTLTGCSFDYPGLVVWDFSQLCSAPVSHSLVIPLNIQGLCLPLFVARLSAYHPLSFHLRFSGLQFLCACFLRSSQFRFCSAVHQCLHLGPHSLSTPLVCRGDIVIAQNLR